MTPHRTRRPALALALALAATAAGATACASSTTAPIVHQPTDTPRGHAHTQHVDAPGAGFTVHVAAGQHLATSQEQSPPADPCPRYLATLTTGNTELLIFATAATTCPADHEAPGNGRHGLYRTDADLPGTDATGRRHVPTALGDATVFTQRYYECTNSCHTWSEAVALITLDHPAGHHRALTVYAPKGSMSAADLASYLHTRISA